MRTRAQIVREIQAKTGVKIGQSLLTFDNPKTSKNVADGYLTAVLHLAPARLSGYNTCSAASAGCAAACLHTAGNPAYLQAKNKARINRTIVFVRARKLFMELLVLELGKFFTSCLDQGLKPAVRLNGTSDIPWERVKITMPSGDEFSNIFSVFRGEQFYDYTKRIDRLNNSLPTNYHITFSRSESNDKDVRTALELGFNVAIVFLDRPERIRIGGRIYTVVDGDRTDFRPADGQEVIVGLKAKGKAKHDDSGFVIGRGSAINIYRTTGSGVLTLR